MNETKKTVTLNNVNSIGDEKEAQKQVDLFVGFYDIDPYFIAEEQQGAIGTAIKSLLKHIMRGRVEIAMGEDGILVTQHLVGDYGKLKKLVYKPLNTHAKMEADKGDGPTERINFMLGSLSDGGSAEMEKLKHIDCATAECVGNLFFVA